MRWIVGLFVAVPLVELALLIVIGSRVGVLPTVAFTVAMGVIGGLLVRREGQRVWQRWKQAIAELRAPEAGIVDGVLVLLGAILLLTPGVLSDAAGIVLLLPWTRRRVATRLRAAIDARIASGQLQAFSFGSIPGRQAPIETTGEPVEPD